MNRAAKLPQYSDMHGFTKPAGDTSDVRIDKVTNRPADPTCPNDFTVAFLDGTIPPGTCSSMSDTGQTIVDRLLQNGNKPQQPQ